jgi:two-component system chemotaxis sensor kinase CheA
MDVVKRNVESLKGSLAVSTERGHGTKVQLRVPLTLAILDGLALRVGKQTFIVPLLAAIESFRPTPGQVRGIFGSQDIIDVRGASLPIARLHEILGVPDAVSDPCAGLVCVVESNGAHLAVLVDEILGQLQVVVKSLDMSYGTVDAVMGATILGDGRVAMILDVGELARRACATKTSFDRKNRSASQTPETAWTS